jgi:hypothetical protein
MAHPKTELEAVAAAVAETRRLILVDGLSLSAAAAAAGVPKGTASKRLAGDTVVQEALRVSAEARHQESLDRKAAYNKDYLRERRQKAKG